MKDLIKIIIGAFIIAVIVAVSDLLGLIFFSDVTELSTRIVLGVLALWIIVIVLWFFHTVGSLFFKYNDCNNWFNRPK